MKDILNAKIKRRESFRPFAPSVLAESVADWFEEEDEVPFMMQVFQIKADKRPQIPAVTHVDGSGRLQTVRSEANPRYHALISAFRDLTGVPMVLNTSFNENEPVVCRPQEALDCFLRTRMDVLVLGDVFVERTDHGVLKPPSRSHSVRWRSPITEASPSSATSTSPHMPELDGMRGVLACMVMLFHLGLNTLLARATGGRIHGGRFGLAVDFFFLLSGFVLCRSFLRRSPGLAQYAIKRLFRLAPMFLIATVAVLAITGLTFWGRAALAANLTMTQSLLGLPSIDLVAWTVPFELYFPAVGLVLLGLGRRAPAMAIWALLLIALVAQSWATWRMAAGDDWPAARAAFGLAAGALLFLAYRPGASHPWAAPVVLTVFAMASSVMAVAGVYPVAALAFPALGAASIWFGADLNGIFSTRPLQALGRWSYSIYLLHIPVLLAANAILGEGRVRGDFPLKLALIAVVVALSGLAYRFVEAPLMRLGQRLTR